MNREPGASLQQSTGRSSTYYTHCTISLKGELEKDRETLISYNEGFGFISKLVLLSSFRRNKLCFAHMCICVFVHDYLMPLEGCHEDVRHA